jgi:hypothetical protein
MILKLIQRKPVKNPVEEIWRRMIAMRYEKLTHVLAKRRGAAYGADIDLYSMHTLHQPHETPSVLQGGTTCRQK